MKKYLIVSIALMLVLSLVGCAFGKPKAVEGEKTVTLIVVHGDGTENKQTVQTDAEYLEEVLLDTGILKAEDDENGLYSTFDGEKADWNADQAWWKLFEGDTESVRGVKEIPLTDGGVYKMVYTIGF